jgi:biopolymer transport protein ExbD
MAMAVGSRAGLKSDPNITPFIDVLLVLLVIFMMALPMMRRVLEIQVPIEDKSQNPTPPIVPIVLSIDANGVYSINTQPVTFEGLAARFHEIYDVRPDKLLFLKVDNTRPFSEVVQAIDIARGAGVLVFGLAPPDTAAAAAATTGS